MHQPQTAVREVLEMLRGSSGGASDKSAKSDKTEVPSAVGVRESTKATGIRGGLASRSTSALKKPELVALQSEAVAAMEVVLKEDNKIVICKDMDAMAVALAEDEDTSVEAAKDKLVGNQARAFTAERVSVLADRLKGGRFMNVDKPFFDAILD